MHFLTQLRSDAFRAAKGKPHKAWVVESLRSLWMGDYTSPYANQKVYNAFADIVMKAVLGRSEHGKFYGSTRLEKKTTFSDWAFGWLLLDNCFGYIEALWDRVQKIEEKIKETSEETSEETSVETSEETGEDSSEETSKEKKVPTTEYSRAISMSEVWAGDDFPYPKYTSIPAHKPPKGRENCGKGWSVQGLEAFQGFLERVEAEVKNSRSKCYSQRYLDDARLAGAKRKTRKDKKTKEKPRKKPRTGLTFGPIAV